MIAEIKIKDQNLSYNLLECILKRDFKKMRAEVRDTEGRLEGLIFNTYSPSKRTKIRWK